MKKSFRLSLLVVVSAALFFVFFILTRQKPVFQDQPQVGNKPTFGLPVELIIPAISVDANIQNLGVTPNGEMEVPGNIIEVGWFKLGPRPGEKGSAVIAGHLNGENNKAGVFLNLDKLEAGDKLYIKDDNGASIVFVVREKRVYDSGYADDVFSRSDGAYLNLVTCDGVWNEAKKNYSKRLVVLADLEK